MLTSDFKSVHPWTTPGAVVYEDPRFNLFAPKNFSGERTPKWMTQSDVSPVDSEPSVDSETGDEFNAADFLHTHTNQNETAYKKTTKNLGTPWWFPNRPLHHAAELAYLFDDPLTSTNIILGIDQTHTAALVDCLAAIP